MISHETGFNLDTSGQPREKERQGSLKQLLLILILSAFGTIQALILFKGCHPIAPSLNEYVSNYYPGVVKSETHLLTQSTGVSAMIKPFRFYALAWEEMRAISHLL